MPGPPPKPSTERRRKNKPDVDAVIDEGDGGLAPDQIPPLPPVVIEEDGDGEVTRDWNSETVRWWTSLWTSPVARQFTTLDVFELVRMAQLIDEVNWGNLDKGLLGEIRQMADRFGLSPLARRRLGWVVKRGDVNDRPQAADNVVPISKGIRQRALGQ